MPEEPMEPERPPDEAWWERELHRNEKLMDRYMAVLGDNPDWDKWKDPTDLYNKVHHDIDPPEAKDDDADDSNPIPDEEEFLRGMNEAAESDPEDAEQLDSDNDPERNADFDVIEEKARKFAVSVFALKDLPGQAELLYLSAGKVGANLAGGHGLGYDEETICGNIVKCRWALSDCEFCGEMFDQLHAQTNDQRYTHLIAQGQQLAGLLRDRIARLRKRVWW